MGRDCRSGTGDRFLLPGVALLIATVLLEMRYKWSGGLAKLLLARETGTMALKEAFATTGVPVGQAVLNFSLNYFSAVWKAMLFGVLIAGALRAFLPEERLAGYMRGARGYLLGTLTGSSLCMCSCCATPIFASLHRKGAGLGQATAFMVSSPALNPFSILLIATVLSYRFAVARLLMGLAIALGVSYLLCRAFGGPRVPGGEEAPSGQSSGIREWLRASWSFTRMVVPLMLLGVLAAGAMKVLLPPSVVSGYLGGGVMPILIASTVGVLLPIPTFGEIPLTMGFLQLGMGAGPAMALLITLPTINLASLLISARVAGKRYALFLGSAVWAFGVLGGLAVAAL